MRVGGCFARLRHFAVAAQDIHDNGFMPTPHQRRLQIGADEAGAPSYQDHGRAIYEVMKGGESRIYRDGGSSKRGVPDDERSATIFR